MQVYLIDINVSADDENTLLRFQDIRKKNKVSRMDTRTDRRIENSISHHKQSLRGV